MSTRPRTPRGVPAGGEFAAAARSPAGIDLPGGGDRASTPLVTDRLADASGPSHEAAEAAAHDASPLVRAVALSGCLLSPATRRRLAGDEEVTRLIAYLRGGEEPLGSDPRLAGQVRALEATDPARAWQRTRVEADRYARVAGLPPPGGTRMSRRQSHELVRRCVRRAHLDGEREFGRLAYESMVAMARARRAFADGEAAPWSDDPTATWRLEELAAA